MATEEGETTAAAAGQQEADGQQQATGMATIPEGTIANSPELIALLNPALARAMLPDGITPDHMTRLKHAMARDYGYIGPWDGWSASMRMRGVTQMDVRPDLVGPNAKFYVLYHCPGKPACRSMNDVAKALGFQVIPRRGAAAAAAMAGGSTATVHTNSGGGNSAMVAPATVSVGKPERPDLPPFDPGLPNPSSTTASGKPSSKAAKGAAGSQQQTSSVHSVPAHGPMSTTTPVAPLSAPTSPTAVLSGNNSSRPSAVATVALPTVSALPHKQSSTMPVVVAAAVPPGYTPAVSETLVGTTTLNGSAGTLVFDAMQQEQLAQMLTPASQQHTSPANASGGGPVNQWLKGKGANGSSTSGKRQTGGGGAGRMQELDPGFGAQQMMGPPEMTETQAVFNRSRRTSNNMPVLPPVSLATSGAEEGGADGGAPAATPHGMPSDHDMNNTAAALAMLSGDPSMAGIPGYDPSAMGMGVGWPGAAPMPRPKASSLKGVLQKQKQKKMMASGGVYDMAGQFPMDVDPYGMNPAAAGMPDPMNMMGAPAGLWTQSIPGSTAAPDMGGKQGGNGSGGPAALTAFGSPPVGAPGVVMPDGVTAATMAAGAVPGGTTTAAAVVPVVDPYTGATTGLTTAQVPVVAIAGPAPFVHTGVPPDPAAVARAATLQRLSGGAMPGAGHPPPLQQSMAQLALAESGPHVRALLELEADEVKHDLMVLPGGTRGELYCQSIEDVPAAYLPTVGGSSSEQPAHNRHRLLCNMCGAGIMNLHYSCGMDGCGWCICPTCARDARAADGERYQGLRLCLNPVCPGPTSGLALLPRRLVGGTWARSLSALPMVLSSVEAAATAESLTAKAVEQLQATASGSTVPAVNGYKGEDEAGYIALWGERLRPEDVRRCRESRLAPGSSGSGSSDDDYVFTPHRESLTPGHPDFERNVKLFLSLWSRGCPIVVRGVKGSLDWSTSALLAAASASDAARQPEGAPPPETFVKVLDCKTWLEHDMEETTFFEGYVHGVTDQQGQPCMLAVRNWPANTTLGDRLEGHTQELLQLLPLPQLTHPTDGPLNLAALNPSWAPPLPATMGPRADIAYGQIEEHEEGELDSVTKLHMAPHDNMYIMAHTLMGEGEEEAVRCGGVAPVPGSSYGNAGAIWDVFEFSHIPQLRSYLATHMGEFTHRGVALSNDAVVDPLLDQTVVMTSTHVMELAIDTGNSVIPWHIEQYQGEALLVPAACPHQVRNLRPCVKVVAGFIAPTSLPRCHEVAQALRAAYIGAQARARCAAAGTAPGPEVPPGPVGPVVLHPQEHPHAQSLQVDVVALAAAAQLTAAAFDLKLGPLPGAKLLPFPGPAGINSSRHNHAAAGPGTKVEGNTAGPTGAATTGAAAATPTAMTTTTDCKDVVEATDLGGAAQDSMMAVNGQEGSVVVDGSTATPTLTADPAVMEEDSTAPWPPVSLPDHSQSQGLQAAVAAAGEEEEGQAGQRMEQVQGSVVKAEPGSMTGTAAAATNGHAAKAGAPVADSKAAGPPPKGAGGPSSERVTSPKNTRATAAAAAKVGGSNGTAAKAGSSTGPGKSSGGNGAGPATKAAAVPSPKGGSSTGAGAGAAKGNTGATAPGGGKSDGKSDGKSEAGAAAKVLGSPDAVVKSTSASPAPAAAGKGDGASASVTAATPASGASGGSVRRSKRSRSDSPAEEVGAAAGKPVNGSSGDGVPSALKKKTLASLKAT